MPIEQVLMLIVLALYAAATVWSEVAVATGGRLRSWPALGLTGLGLALHTLALVLYGVHVGRVPMADLGEIISLLLWLAVALYLALQLVKPLAGLGAFYLPIVTALAALAAALAGRPSADTGARSPLLAIHGAAALLGFAAFALAAVAAVMFLVQDHALKRHRLGRLSLIFPSVQRLERFGYSAVGFGFIFLTVSLGLGIHLARRMGHDWATEHTVLLSILTWLVFAVLLHVRLTRAWRGRKVAWFTLAGFALVVVVFVVMLFTTDTLHKFFT